MANTNAMMSGAAAGSSFGPWGAVIGGAAGLLMGGGGGGSDAAAQQQQANQAAQLAWNKQQDPFSAEGNREQYIPQLNQLMQGGVAGVGQDPTFQALNQESLTNVQRQQAAAGRSGSGLEASTMLQQSMGNQMNYFNQQYTRLSELSGASRGGGAAVTGQSPGSAFDQSMASYQSKLNMMFGGAGLGDSLANIFGSTGGTQDWQQNTAMQNAPVSTSEGA